MYLEESQSNRMLNQSVPNLRFGWRFDRNKELYYQKIVLKSKGANE